MSIRSALRELSHKEASLDEIEEFQRQVDDEKNDLGACILMATKLSLPWTSRCFASWTGTKTRGRLVSEEGPAGTFSQKILLGRALRIYREDTHHNLEYIRFIRNAIWRNHKGW